MTSITMHPSELAYAFSYSNTADIIGWGRDPFLPTTDADGDPKAWYVVGAERLSAAGRITETEEDGLNFSSDVTSIVLALADPALVLLTERKEGDGLRRMTVHVGHDMVVGMTRNPTGMFDLTLYADLTAAILACTGYLGASLTPTQAGARLDTTQEALAEVQSLATTGQGEAAVSKLVVLGVSESDAASVVKAMDAPTASGMLSVLYCSDNIAMHAEPFSVLTNSDGDTWILFPPASIEGPMVLEQSSVPALTARVIVGVAARTRAAA